MIRHHNPAKSKEAHRGCYRLHQPGLQKNPIITILSPTKQRHHRGERLVERHGTSLCLPQQPRCAKPQRSPANFSHCMQFLESPSMISHSPHLLAGRYRSAPPQRRAATRSTAQYYLDFSFSVICLDRRLVILLYIGSPRRPFPVLAAAL